MNLLRIVTGAKGKLYTNCYIVFGENKAMLIDPGFDYEKIEAKLGGLPVEKIILTHGHLDHFYELNYFKGKYNPTVYMHDADKAYLSDFVLNAPQGLLDWMEKRSYSVDQYLSGGETVEFDDKCFEIIHTPGHTPGGICIKCEDVLFTGDTIFASAVGRTDFPGGSLETLSRSVHKIILMDEDVRVYPGHGLSTTIGKERVHYY